MTSHTLNETEIELVKKELEDIQNKEYNIGDVSDLMKRMIHEVYGDEELSTSGYWVRAQQLLNNK